MKNVITISRQYGSGGRLIGEQAANRLGYAFYDSEIIKNEMVKRGFSQDMVDYGEQKDKASGSFLFNLVMNLNVEHGSESRIVQEEQKVIKALAVQGPCVIVGRAANFLLDKSFNALHVYAYADRAFRIQNAIDNYGIAPDEAEKMVEDTDRIRKAHISSFYGKDWGDPASYDLLLNTGSLGIEKCIEILCSAVK